MGEAGELAGCAALGTQAGDGVHDFLGDQASGQVVDVSADPGDLGGMGEVDAVGGSDPDGALHDTAVSLVGTDVVGVRPAVGLDFGEDGGLQGGLVALDGQQVVGLALPGDVGGGVVLGVNS